MPNRRRNDTRALPNSESRRITQNGNSYDAIARRAYERFETRGGEHGHDLEDWFEAERELGRQVPRT
jgi:hypothetical protein